MKRKKRPREEDVKVGVVFLNRGKGKTKRKVLGVGFEYQPEKWWGDPLTAPTGEPGVEFETIGGRNNGEVSRLYMSSFLQWTGSIVDAESGEEVQPQSGEYILAPEEFAFDTSQLPTILRKYQRVAIFVPVGATDEVVKALREMAKTCASHLEELSFVSCNMEVRSGKRFAAGLLSQRMGEACHNITVMTHLHDLSHVTWGRVAALWWGLALDGGYGHWIIGVYECKSLTSEVPAQGNYRIQTLPSLKDTSAVFTNEGP